MWQPQGRAQSHQLLSPKPRGPSHPACCCQGWGTGPVPGRAEQSREGVLTAFPSPWGLLGSTDATQGMVALPGFVRIQLQGTRTVELSSPVMAGGLVERSWCSSLVRAQAPRVQPWQRPAQSQCLKPGAYVRPCTATQDPVAMQLDGSP